MEKVVFLDPRSYLCAAESCVAASDAPPQRVRPPSRQRMCGMGRRRGVSRERRRETVWILARTGVYSWADGSKYEGEWKDGVKHGTHIPTPSLHAHRACLQEHRHSKIEHRNLSC